MSRVPRYCKPHRDTCHSSWNSSAPRWFPRSFPTRDLATSIAWALYALVLLAASIVRASTGLRWASLALLLLTIAKVFLHDLGELRDLCRVASLAGLAISLLAVSVAYQRFVFRTVAPVQRRRRNAVQFANGIVIELQTFSYRTNAATHSPG